MNKRIRQLAEQAMVERASGFKEFDADVFAELIVRECVQTLIDNTPERFTNEAAEEDWDKGYDRAMRDCIHHIKEHFGVEEQTIKQDQVPLPTTREQAMAMLRVATFYLDTQK